MVRKAVLAGLLASCAVVPARAADAELFKQVAGELEVGDPERYDERALLAGLLSRPNEAAAFRAEGSVALGDPVLRGLFIKKWRGRVAAFAETERNRPPIDLTRSYRDWKDVAGPEGYAYTRERLKSLTKARADLLLYYLGELDEKLRSGGFRIENSRFSVAKKIVEGIREQYIKDIAAYQAAPATARAAAAAPAAELALAEGLRKKAAELAAAAAPRPRPTTALPPRANDALSQARAAERAGPAADAVFDGGTSAGSPAVAGSDEASRNPVRLSPPTERPSIAGSVPPPGAEEDDIDARIAQARRDAPKPLAAYLPHMGAGVGAALGAVLGFLLGGPIGAALGAALVGAGGYAAVKKFT
ncbi:MAG: hypothetical protein HY403_07635 [Elusimicrobia bacterium]|nr:hypothetical protein [Elusimicrobiota bacterium]